MEDDEETVASADEAEAGEDAEAGEAEYEFEGFQIEINERIALTPVTKAAGHG